MTNVIKSPKKVVVQRRDTGRVIAELRSILATNPDEKLQAAAVVDFARSPKTALHSYFVWDDTQAAGLWRLAQARALIRTFVVVHKTPRGRDIPIRVFHSLTPDRKLPGGGYRTFDAISADAMLFSTLVADCRRDFEIFKAKYQFIVQLQPAFEAFTVEIAKLPPTPSATSKPTHGETMRKAGPPRD